VFDLASIGDALFSKTQQKVLGLLFGRPDKTFYLNEIVRLAGVGKGSVNRELEKMRAAGLLTVTRIGNQNHYQANAECPIYDELLGIVRKSFGLVGDTSIMQTSNGNTLVIGGNIEISRSELRDVAQRFHIRRLYLFGSAARGELRPDSDIDLLVEFDSQGSPSMGGMVDIQDAFVKLFHGRKVDVATPSILNNPYRKRSIEKDMEELYAA
jgi:predicted nucleotidyltransferase